MSVINTIIAVLLAVLLVILPSLCLFGYIVILLIKALKKYVGSAEVRKEKDSTKKSLGEVLKQYREESKMTQEFVAESLGVSRQTVSKWENGVNDPSTSNLIALSKLFQISPEELIQKIK